MNAKRNWSEDEIADYHETMQELMYQRQQAKQWARNAGKHVSDPDREWGDEE